MEKWIIIKMIEPNQVYSIYDLEDLAECHALNGQLLIFDSLDEASNYQEEYGISGQCISLPIY